MVQELNSLAYSTIFSNRQSFISTHISDGDYSELRRYSIVNSDQESQICQATRKKIYQEDLTLLWFFKQYKSRDYHRKLKL